jgi:hypothetical protein
LSSSATDQPFQRALEAALGMIAREQRSLYALLCRELGQSSIDTRVEAERVRIEGDGSEIHVITSAPNPVLAPDAIRVESDLRTIDDLLDGRTSLLDVVLQDRVLLFGELDRLLRAHDALIVFLRAAVRCPSAPGLLRRFRADVHRLTRPAPARPVLDPTFSAA